MKSHCIIRGYAPPVAGYAMLSPTAATSEHALPVTVHNTHGQWTYFAMVIVSHVAGTQKCDPVAAV